MVTTTVIHQFNSSENDSGTALDSLVQSSSLGTNKPEDFRILIVDDEPDLLDMLAYDLGRVGFQVETAQGGNEALSKYKNLSFDLVITDIRMPNGDGLSLLKNIKSIDSSTPVVCITGFSDTPNAKIMDMGALAVFEKPFNSKKLHAVLFKELGLLAD